MKTKHFNPVIDKKMVCSCCGAGELVVGVMAILELVRHHFQAPVTVLSGYRCKTYNKAVGGADKSQHKRNTAVDIQVKGHSPKEVFDFLNGVFPDDLGLGLYDTFVHFDVRDCKARW